MTTPAPVTDLPARLEAHVRWVTSAGTDGQQLSLPGAPLAGVDFSGRDLTEANLGEAVLDGARLDSCNLAGAHLAGASLEQANFHGAHLAKASLDRVRAPHAWFSGTNLLRTSFVGANLVGASFDGALLRRTLFAKADLRSCALRRAQMDRTAFDEAIFGQVDATGASGTLVADRLTIETASGSSVVDAEALVAYLRAAGAAGLVVFDPVSQRGEVTAESAATQGPATSSSSEPAGEPGWFPDPQRRHEHRWWDGSRWTSHVADHGAVTTDPQ